MAYDTKALVVALADSVAKSNTLKEADLTIMKAANVEGVALKSYEDAIEEIEEARK
jgi:hypothetical protein